MDIALTLTVFLGIVLCVSSQKTMTEMTFSCHRPTTPCKNSGNCKSTGQCHCPPGTYGLQCEITASEQDLNVADCLEANPCVNYGRCYYDQGTKAAACFCPAGYYGAKCELHMLDVDCSEDKMRVYVLPWGYDKGTWTLDNPTITGTTAQLSPVEDFAAVTPDFKPQGRKGFVGDFLHVFDPAAGSATVEFEDTQTITYSRGVQVVYSAKGSSPVDQELKVGCMVAKPPSDGTSTTSQPAAQPGGGGVTPQTPPPTVTMPPGSGGFHCQRPSTPCHPESGGCSQFSGQCQCGAARTGLQCAVLVADVNAGACRTMDPCTPERGLCYDSGAGAACTCADGYYGQLCQHEMAHTECDQGQMTVNIFPYGFDEAVWPALLKPLLSYQNTVCKMKTVQEFVAVNPGYAGRGFEGFADTYLHAADPCAGGATVVSDNVTTTVYSRQIAINYDPLASHHTDQLITVTCSVEKNNAAARPDATLPANTPPTASVTDAPPAQIDMGTGTGTGVNPAPSLPSGSILPPGPAVTQPPSVPGQLPSDSQGPGFGFPEQLPPPRVRIALTDEDGMPIRGMVKLGSMVKATFSLDPYNSRDVTDLRVDSCIVTDHVSGENVVVVENGCVQRPMGMLLYRQGRGTRVLIVKIYKFSTSADLSFRCRVYLCRQGDASCWTAPSCSIRFRRSLNGILTDTYKHVTAVETRLTGH